MKEEMKLLFLKHKQLWNLRLPYTTNVESSSISFWSRNTNISDNKNANNENVTKIETKVAKPIVYQYKRENNEQDVESINCANDNSTSIEKVVGEQKVVENQMGDSNCNVSDTHQRVGDHINVQHDQNQSEMATTCCEKAKEGKRKGGIFRTPIVNWMSGQDCEERARIMKVRTRPRSKCGFNFQYRISPYPLCPVPDSIKPEGMWPSLDVETLMLRVGIEKHPLNDPCKKLNFIEGKELKYGEPKCKEETKKEETVCKTMLGPPTPKPNGPCFPPGGRLPKRRRLSRILIPILLLGILGLIVVCNEDDEEDCVDDEEGDQ